MSTQLGLADLLEQVTQCFSEFGKLTVAIVRFGCDAAFCVFVSVAIDVLLDQLAGFTVFDLLWRMFLEVCRWLDDGAFEAVVEGQFATTD